jgi:hypothetical protein
MRALVFAIASVAVFAQLPGQYPPGQYPPGQGPGQPGSRGRYPGQTPYPQPPIPGQTGPNGRPGGRNPQGDSRRTTRDKNTAIVTTTTGILRRATTNQLVIEADDHRIIWFRLGDKISVQKEGKEAALTSFALGDYLSVDSTADDQDHFTAVEVSWQKAATAADRAAASKDWDLPRAEQGWRPASAADSKPAITREPGDDRPVLRRKNPDPPKPAESSQQPTPASQQTAAAPQPAPEEEVDPRPTTTLRPADPPREEDDSGPPALRRGTPAHRRAPVRIATSSGESASSAGPRSVVRTPDPEPEPSPVAVAQAGPILPQEDPVIAKAREAAETYSGTLPNFFAQQMTTRYQKEGRESWQALDIVSADVAYENGRESYKNIKVGNKAVNKSMEEIGGTHSTGEFATVLDAVMSPGSGATFRRNGQDTLRNRAAWKYTFEMPRERSGWRVESPSQLYYPAYRGSIWIDKETSRVLRIEQQGRSLPVLFPFDTVETAADYDFIRLGTAGPFLLPVEAEVLSCQRGTSLCSRNQIEFRNYRKFGAESSVVFDDKQ